VNHPLPSLAALAATPSRTADGYTVDRVHTWNPNGVALGVMGVTARRAARAQTMREWCARLATRAGPKDYVGQLRQLYLGIIERWRYVMEDGEHVHGTARSLLGHVLGAKYNCGPTCKCPEACDVEATPWREKGWGDCDDVSTLVASGVIALGMTPYWRVSHSPSGAHVAVLAVTPRGERVELDPVLHPQAGFNARASGPGVTSKLFEMSGKPIAGFGAPMNTGYVSPYQSTFAPTFMGGASRYMGASPPQPGDIRSTLVGTMRVGESGVLSPVQSRSDAHFCVVQPGDMRGSRVLAVPEWHAQMLGRGVSWHRTPAVDQFGASWRYNGDMDAWLPSGHPLDREWTPMGSVAAHQMHEIYLGRARARGRLARKAKRRSRRKRRRARIRKGAKKVGKFFKKIHRGFQRVGSFLLKSKFVQSIVAGVLQVFGVPMVITKKLMSVAGNFMGKGGLGKLLRLAKKSPKSALKFLASAVKASGNSNLLKKFKVPGFSGYGVSPMGEVLQVEIEDFGQSYHAAPVEAIVGLPGVYEFGFGKADMMVQPTPEPGYWYRIQKGDNLMKIAKMAFGPSHAIRHAKWINAAVANQAYMRAAKTDFERKHIGDELISFRPQYSDIPADAIQGLPGNRYATLWIPPAEGVEPPAYADDEADDGEGDLPSIPDTPPPAPAPPAPAPRPADDEDDDDVDEPLRPPPLGPIVPVFPDDPIPPQPDGAPPADDHDEPRADDHATNEDVIEDRGGGLKPIPWGPPPDSESGGAALAVAAGLGLLALM